MILVSRYWPTRKFSDAELKGAHPHLVELGGGCGNGRIYPDEMWEQAKNEFEALKEELTGNEAPGVVIRYEWIKGYPQQRSVCVGSVCSLDDRPEDFLPALVVSNENPRIHI